MATARAAGSFTVSAWDENTYEELDGGGKLTKAHVTFGFDGDLEGDGGWEAVMCYGADGTASFTGFQRTVGKLGGRAGSFVLRADGSFEGGAARTTWEVVDGSATGELTGLHGTGEAVSTGGSGGTYSFDYALG
jgi:Protein of unknown function (DUF3224)